MRCLVCGNEFIVKRYFTDLFNMKKYYVCLECIKKYPLKVQFNFVPLQNHQLKIISIFEKPFVKYDGFIHEYSEIYRKICDNYRCDYVLLYDSFRLQEGVLKEFDLLAEIENKDIVILTNVFTD